MTRRIAASGRVSLAAIVALFAWSVASAAPSKRPPKSTQSPSSKSVRIPLATAHATPTARATATAHATATATDLARAGVDSHTTAYPNPSASQPVNSAVEPHSDTASYVSPSGRDAAEAAPSFHPSHRVAVTVDPLPLALGRYGGNVEIALFPHHAVVASAFVQTFPGWMLRALTPSGAPAADATTARPGGELGWRVYTSREGAEGLFAGVSAVAMPIVQARLADDLHADLVSVTALGGAFDVGVQAITSGGFTIGGGLGVMALAYARPPSVSTPPGVDAPSFPSPHVLPRVLFATGWAF